MKEFPECVNCGFKRMFHVVEYVGTEIDMAFKWLRVFQLQGAKGLAKNGKKGAAVLAQKPEKPELGDVLPKWDIGISEGVKRKKRSSPRIIEDTRWAPSKKCKAVKSPDKAGPSTRSLASEFLKPPTEGCPIEDSMDDELLACVFMKLNMKDLSASMRACKRWHRVACKEDVWEHIPLPANVPGALPRYVA